MIKINNTNITNVYKGTDVISKIYKGVDLVYEKNIDKTNTIKIKEYLAYAGAYVKYTGYTLSGVLWSDLTPYTGQTSSWYLAKIPIKANTEYIYAGFQTANNPSYFFLKEDNTIVEGKVIKGQGTFTTPVDAVYIVMSISSTYLNTATLTKTEYPSKVLISSGTQYINLGVNADPNLKIEIKMNGLVDKSYTGVFGSRDTSSSKRFGVFGNSTGNLRFDFAKQTGSHSAQAKFVADEPYVLKKDGIDNYYNNTLVYSNTYTDFESDFPLYLFAFNNGETPLFPCKMKVYYVKIWNENNELLRDMIPVETGDTVDGLTAISNCLYDKVSKTFFENMGTGNFTIESASQEQNLRNIQVGDDLSGKTLYCEIPDTFYNECELFSNVIISDNYMIYESPQSSNMLNVQIASWSGGYTNNLYSYNGSEVTTNLKTIVLPDDFR